MPKIETIVLPSFAPDAQRQFYCDVLGMQVLGDDAVGYGGGEAQLSFPQAKNPYAPSPNDIYWKIAIGVPNIELACQQLMKRGISVSPPRQFQDIGYLAHFADPEGFTIELIEHWFQGNRPQMNFNPGLLGGGAHVNLLTLRSHDIRPVNEACTAWNMKPLSIQPVENYGFTLYFYAFTDDVPPSSDLYAVENREWLYQRRYTVLEVQHVHQGSRMNMPRPGDAGYAMTVFSGFSETSWNDMLAIKTVG